MKNYNYYLYNVRNKIREKKHKFFEMVFWNSVGFFCGIFLGKLGKLILKTGGKIRDFPACSSEFF